MDNLTLGPRPKFKKIKNRSEQVIFTLLKTNEDAPAIGTAVKKADKIWVHCPLSVRHHDFSPWRDWVEAAELLELALDVMGQTVYLHCAAGIHRTGSLAYLYFRRKAYTPEQARAKVFQMRPVIEDQINTKMFEMEAMIQDNAWGGKI